MNLQAYFDRIRYVGDVKPTLDTLTALHTAHTFNIPFENLDVYAGKRISLEPNAIFDKLVTRRRGGYCFEMNGLFAFVLRELGFEVRQLLARTAFGGTYSAKLHEVLAVDIGDKTYVADVGYGNYGIAAPLLLEIMTEQTQFVDTYRFMSDSMLGFVLERKLNGAFIPMYAFSTESCVPDDFEVANHYTATHPDSFFKLMRFATKPTPAGRVTLADSHLKIVSCGAAIERNIRKPEFRTLLHKLFGIEWA
ncbi:MAG: arylamine N-acetyltransferase [Clostridiales Family XIII bacterium]|jgi:N-hydroxyarylamine O-acetyltransferase|nr:arylamine N-acetyltransferase [Clostridiales Family XIII bacterium]